MVKLHIFNSCTVFGLVLRALQLLYVDNVLVLAFKQIHYNIFRQLLGLFFLYWSQILNDFSNIIYLDNFECLFIYRILRQLSLFLLGLI